MRLSDFLWFSILAAILSLVAWIGTTMILETRHTAAAIENVHRIKDWMAVNGPSAQHTSQADEPPEDCAPPNGTLAACADWVDHHPPKAGVSNPACSVKSGAIRSCLDQLVSVEGDLKDIQNTFDSSAPVFAASCNASDPKTIGAIMPTVGKPKSATDQTLEYKPLKGQTFEQVSVLRLTVCGRLYRPAVPIDLKL
jgi:hypothetical protein